MRQSVWTKAGVSRAKVWPSSREQRDEYSAPRFAIGVAWLRRVPNDINIALSISGH